MEITRRGDAAGGLAAFGIVQGPNAGSDVPVPTPVVTIGKDSTNEVILDDDSVSARHARLEFVAGDWALTDLGSTNGTAIDGATLAPETPTVLPYGATVRFGGVRATFHPVADADPGAARDAYVAPDLPERLRDRRRVVFPVWAMVLLLLLLVIAALVAIRYIPADALGGGTGMVVPSMLAPGSAA